MSGGSWDYRPYEFADMAECLRHDTCPKGYKLDLNEHQKAERRFLADVVIAVSEALHAIEWVDSSDWSYPEDVDAIAKVKMLLAKSGTP